MPNHSNKRRLIVWTRISLLLFVFISLTVLSPIASSLGFDRLGDGIHHAYGFLCHQIPGRSFWILDGPLAVCARCFGIYFGLLIGALVLPLGGGLKDDGMISAVWILASLIPMGTDWALTYFGVWENTGMSRFVTGGVVGLACGYTITKSIIGLACPLKKEELPSGSS
jgi:uncharacterized membrane protein